jgi:hypothetical protein
MLDRFDDYPIHQVPEPVQHTGSGDRNHYDRYFFNGYTRDGSLFFAIALGLYPNRRVMDASVSIVRAGRQHALHASRLAPLERGELRVGPISIEVVEPMRTLRVRVLPNQHQVEADLTFRARTSAVEEPRFVNRADGRVFMDSTRFAQFGCWEGWIAVADDRVKVDPTQVLGCRDRSWGIRSVGEPETGPPPSNRQFFWLWGPINFDDLCTHFGVNEFADGRAWHASGCSLPLIGPQGSPTDEAGVVRMSSVAHQVKWQPGTRRAESVRLTLSPHRGEALVIDLEPILTFQMLGLGYLHFEWGHGYWKGEEALGFETWTLEDLDPLGLQFIHVQQLCRARMGSREGIGVFEQLVLGPHDSSGFKDLLDGAPTHPDS